MFNTVNRCYCYTRIKFVFPKCHSGTERIRLSTVPTAALHLTCMHATHTHTHSYNVYEFRRKSGEILAEEWAKLGLEADMVMPVPDSGIPSAIGFANHSGIPYMEGLVKNRYVGRTFIQPTQELRETAVKLKLSPLRQNLVGKKVIMIDDSIVRGTTSKRIVEQVRKAGAVEVHLCITSPPVKYSCYYGIDTPYRQNLIGAQKTVEEIRDYIGADSLTYLSLDGLKQACNQTNDFCRACFTGNYPIEVKIEEEEMAI